MDTQSRQAQCAMALRATRYDCPIFETGGVEAGSQPRRRACLATESKRLYELRSAGIAVPELLAVRKNALMFGNLEGIPLDAQIRQEAEAGKADAWLAGLEAIARVHKKRQFLSQAFARNMMWDGKNISFLDFEDDPSEVLTIAQCQARDWLCYIHSTALILKNGGLLEAAAEKWGGVLSDQPAEIQKLIAGTVKPILPIRRLEHPRWGRDALRLAASISLISLADMPP